MIVTKDGLKHDQTKEVTWKETLEARPGDTLLINKPSWTCQYQGGTVISNLKVAVKGFVEHNSMRSDLKGDSETMSDWFPIGEIMDTNSRKVTIPAFVSVGGNEVKFEIDASNIEGLDVDHWYIELSMTFDADYAYLNVEGGSINIGGDLSIGGSLTVPSNKGIIVDNLQGGSIKINQVTGGEIDIDSLKDGEINIDGLKNGEINIDKLEGNGSVNISTMSGGSLTISDASGGGLSITDVDGGEDLVFTDKEQHYHGGVPAIRGHLYYIMVNWVTHPSTHHFLYLHDTCHQDRSTCSAGLFAVTSSSPDSTDDIDDYSAVCLIRNNGDTFDVRPYFMIDGWSYDKDTKLTEARSDGDTYRMGALRIRDLGTFWPKRYNTEGK